MTDAVNYPLAYVRLRFFPSNILLTSEYNPFHFILIACLITYLWGSSHRWTLEWAIKTVTNLTPENVNDFII